MTMLEKMARAVIDEISAQGSVAFNAIDGSTMRVDGDVDLAPLCRAALQAIREPDSALQFAAWLSAPDDDCSDFQRLSDFTAVIDAILSEGEA